MRPFIRLGVFLFTLAAFANSPALPGRTGGSASAASLTVVVDPRTGIEIGIPRILSKQGITSDGGSQWQTPDEKITLRTAFHPGKSDLQAVYLWFMKRPGQRITYRTLGADSFTMVGETEDGKFYRRYAVGPEGIRGFVISYEKRIARSFDPVVQEIARTFNPFPAPRLASSDYSRAEAQFQRLPPHERYAIQMLLATAGRWDAVSTDRYNRRLFAAIQQTQTELGYPPTGILTEEQIRQLHLTADPILAMWDLKEVRHPVSGTPLWVPAGLGLRSEPLDHGLSFRNADDTLAIKFNFFEGEQVDAMSSLLLGALRQEGADILYDAIKPDFFVIVAHKAGARHYVRYHAHRNGIVGFGMSAADGAPFHPERLEVLISDLFRGYFAQPERRVPPIPIYRNLPPPDQVAEAKPAPTPPARPQPPDGGEAKATSGTGFFVSRQGHVLTNAHVVQGCTTLRVSHADDRAVTVRLLAKDEHNDLALLKTDLRPEAVGNLRVRVRLGEDIAAFGYPLSGLLSSGGNFTRGNITALSGLGDDLRHFQISAPVQPGNSGGPLLDMSGNVVGIVVGKLNAIKIASQTNDLAQNVNFAIKASVAVTFLESLDIPFPTGATSSAGKDAADVADLAKQMSVFIACRP